MFHFRSMAKRIKSSISKITVFCFLLFFCDFPVGAGSAGKMTVTVKNNSFKRQGEGDDVIVKNAVFYRLFFLFLLFFLFDVFFGSNSDDTS